MDVSRLSQKYTVRCLAQSDVPLIYTLCRKNELYYKYCPPFVTHESIIHDMKALPPGKTLQDKYYVGFFEGDELIAVLDLIAGYPNDSMAFIGFFMMSSERSMKGVGSEIISELCKSLKHMGYCGIRLGWVAGNPQSEHFWHKNGFKETGVTYATDGYTVVVAEREL